MDRPRVLIIEHSDFHRRLMSELVECNDMKATAVDHVDGDLEAEREMDRATIVVVDLDSRRREDVKVFERLNAMPKRPRIVGVVGAGATGRASRPGLPVEEIVTRPIDTGAFARAIARQALEARRDADE